MTWDTCGETDTSVLPNMTIEQFWQDLRQSSWRRVGNQHACCKECADSLRA